MAEFPSGIRGSYKRAHTEITAGQTNAVLVGSVTSRKIAVYGVVAICGGTATTLRFNSGSAACTPTWANGANGGMVLPVTDVPWFETNTGESLTCNTGAGSTTGILVIYREIV